MLNIELSKLNTWFKINKLSLNVKKTNYMFFSQRRVIPDCNIVIDQASISRVYCTKFLGVLIDDKLSWKSHVALVNSKLCKSLSVFYKVGKILDKSSLFLLYYALIFPYLMYCSEVWGLAYKSTTNCLTVTQNKFVRVISHASKRSVLLPIYRGLNILPFDNIVKLKVCYFMYKVAKHAVPSSIQNRFNLFVEPKRNYRVFMVKYCRSAAKSRSLSVYGPKLFNSLPNDVKCSHSLFHYKRQVKKFLLCTL